MKKNYTIGIDLGGTNVKIALLKNVNIIVQKTSIETDKHKGRSKLIAEIIKIIKQLIKDNKLKKSQIAGIGIGVAGPINFDRGFIHNLTNIKGWKNTPLKQMLTKKIGIRTFVDNDVNVVTLGELAFGAGRGFKDILCLTLGTGVGGGIVLNGHLYRGPNFTAGEIGHIPISITGPKCNCGGTACIERYVGNKFIIQRAKELVKNNKKSLIFKYANNQISKITPKIISQAASDKDKTALLIWREVGNYLGIALSGLVNTLNPELIIIGGGVAKAGKPLFDSIKKTIKLRSMKNPASFVKVVPALLGEEAGIVGASVLADL
ncbi:MAG: ROK family protein, partial [Candidatus Kappaea frigidicola]|nr:ROK family protein [Candidatus Kappaea frigidicola]